MEYTNDKIKRLIKERDSIVSKFNKEINEEIQKEKSKYKFSWKRFSLFIISIILCISAIEINHRIFPKTSIWSWDYYFNFNK